MHKAFELSVLTTLSVPCPIHVTKTTEEILFKYWQYDDGEDVIDSVYF